jgi:pyrroline-5-carboxylate reductase
MTTPITYELGFLGAGNMAEAIARGLISKNVVPASRMLAADPMQIRRDLFTKQLGITTADDNLTVARQCKTIILATKPQTMAEALGGVGQVLPPDSLVISIAAGISTRFIESALGGANLGGSRRRVVRTMPNTPMLYGAGIVGIAPGTHATAADLAETRRLFEPAAQVVEVAEEHIDTVTAVSGSGPAYFFFLVEQMTKAGVELGLPEAVAAQLARATAHGSGLMLAQSTDSAEELRRKVTSPGGTTHAAITHMQTHHWPEITVAAVKAAQARGRELGK